MDPNQPQNNNPQDNTAIPPQSDNLNPGDNIGADNNTSPTDSTAGSGSFDVSAQPPITAAQPSPMEPQTHITGEPTQVTDAGLGAPNMQPPAPAPSMAPDIGSQPTPIAAPQDVPVQPPAEQAGPVPVASPANQPASQPIGMQPPASAHEKPKGTMFVIILMIVVVLGAIASAILLL